MSNEMSALEIAISWFPMLLLIGVWLFSMWRYGIFDRRRMSQSRYLEEILAETKRHNAIMEDILKQNNEQLGRLDAALNKSA